MDRIWTKSFSLMTTGTLFLFIAFYMLYPTLPLFITQMGGSQAEGEASETVCCWGGNEWKRYRNKARYSVRAYRRSYASSRQDTEFLRLTRRG